MTPVEEFANNYTTTLAQPCGPTDPAIYVTTPIPSSLQSPGQFRLKLQSATVPAEYEYVIAQQGTSLTVLSVQRGAEGSTAQAFAAGASVSQVLTQGAILAIEANAVAQATAAVATETSRAEQAEQTLAQAITAEQTRAQTAETALSARIASSGTGTSSTSGAFNGGTP